MRNPEPDGSGENKIVISLYTSQKIKRYRPDSEKLTPHPQPCLHRSTRCIGLIHLAELFFNRVSDYTEVECLDNIRWKMLGNQTYRLNSRPIRMEWEWLNINANANLPAVAPHQCPIRAGPFKMGFQFSEYRNCPRSKSVIIRGLWRAIDDPFQQAHSSSHISVYLTQGNQNKNWFEHSRTKSLFIKKHSKQLLSSASFVASFLSPRDSMFSREPTWAPWSLKKDWK